MDESGASVVIEGETPRDVIAQTLEFAAWVNSLNLDEMDEIARTYALARGMDAGGIQDIYWATFESGESEEDAGDRVTFNAHQRMIIVAELFSPEVEQTLRYMRTTHGVDVTGVRFGIHRAGDETLLNIEVVVGREDAILRD